MVRVVTESWVRARSDEQKEARTAAIVAATARLYEQHEIEEINLATIAKEASFTRSNIYKYFEAKEEIFLELLSRDRSDWLQDLEQTFTSPGISTSEFAKCWVDLHFRHERMTRLMTILNTVLEKNVTVETLVRFKKAYLEDQQRVLQVIMQCFPQMNEDLALEFYYAQMALTVGASSLADYGEVQLAAMEQCNIPIISDEMFHQHYFNCVKALLDGVLERAT